MSMRKIKARTQNTIQLPKLVSILIVDDERFDRARLRRICEKLDFEVLISEADSLETMGTELLRDRFDLIFLDFNMPDGNGLLALDAIQLDEHNSDAAVIMVTGDEDMDVAIASLKNGCSDFVKKETVSLESIRRSSINALQKAALNKGLERETNLRASIESVLNQFTKQCAEEFHPMLFSMMRHVRGLHTVRMDEARYTATVYKIEKSCERLFDFVKDIEDKERKDLALLKVGDIELQPSEAVLAQQRKAERARFFGRRPI